MRAFARNTLHQLNQAIAPMIPLGVYRRALPHSPLGFFYHAVSDEDLPHVKHLYPYKSPAEFEVDLLYLKANYTLVGYDEIKNHIEGQRPLPPNAAFISFDDGFAECFDVVRPLLLKYDAPCMFFLTTAFIDNKRLLFKSKTSLCIEAFSKQTQARQKESLQQIGEILDLTASNFRAAISALRRDEEFKIDAICKILGVDAVDFLQTRKPFMTSAQVRQLRADGFTIGAHGLNHAKLLFLREGERERQITASCRIIGSLVGEDSVPFAFPFSGAGIEEGWLTPLLDQNPHVGLVFDTKGVRKNVGGVVNRIFADRPLKGVSPHKNLQHWEHEAFKNLLASRFA